MMQAHYVKSSILSGVLLLCTLILCMTVYSQTPVFAQITPAPEKFGGNSDDDQSSADSSPHMHGGGSADDGSSGSTSSDETNGNNDDEDITASDNKEEIAGEDSIDELGTNDSNGDGQSTTVKKSDEATPTEDVDSDDTNPSVQEIMNEVNEALSASGITGPGS